jgi:hypothetical protein
MTDPIIEPPLFAPDADGPDLVLLCPVCSGNVRVLGPSVMPSTLGARVLLECLQCPGRTIQAVIYTTDGRTNMFVDEVSP